MVVFFAAVFVSASAFLTDSVFTALSSTFFSAFFASGLAVSSFVVGFTGSVFGAAVFTGSFSIFFGSVAATAFTVSAFFVVSAFSDVFVTGAVTFAVTSFVVAVVTFFVAISFPPKSL